MPDRAAAGSAGYSFTTWPASPPVFEPIATPSKLWIPAGAVGWRDSIKPIASELLEAGAPVLQSIEGAAAALAPARGRGGAVNRRFLTNGWEVGVVEFDPTADADPAWVSFDDQTALRRVQSAEPGMLIEWLERLRNAGVWAHRSASPDLLGQLHHVLRRPIDTVICSVLDADPSACLNSALAAWYGIELAAGVALLSRMTRAGAALIAIDSRVPGSWSSSLRRCAGESIRIVPMVPDYPQSDPTLMLYTLLDRRLRPGRSPVEQGTILLDAAAAIAVGRCALQDAPILSVPLVVRDHELRQSSFVFVPVGTRVLDVLEQAHVSPACSEIRGGDVLRDRLIPADAVISAGGELVLHASTPQPASIPDPCVRCGWCVEACPTRVQPAGVLEAAQRDDLDMAYRLGLDACIECGICTYVCPSRLPLLAGIRRMRVRWAMQISSEV